MSVIHIMLYIMPFIVEKLSLITMHWNHFINTSPSTETIQNVSVTVTQWGVNRVRPALQAHALSSRRRPEYS